VLYYFGRQNDLALALFVLAALLYIFVVHIIVVIHAFKNEGVGMGIGALCLLPFTVFYVFFKSESPTLKMFYGLAILLKMGVWTVKPMLESLK
jgi:hypothetical protein